MRTTLTLDDDVADFLKEQARLRDKPFKQVINDTLRRGMAPVSKGTEAPEFRVVPNASCLVPGIDPQKLNQFCDQLEVEAFAAEGAS